MAETRNAALFSAGSAAGGDWQSAFAAALADAWPLPEGANLGFVYATDYYAPHFGEIVERLRAETGIQQWSGTVGLGIATPEGELFDRPALAILAGRFPEESFRLFGPLSRAAELGALAPGWLERQLGTVALLQADPRTPELETLIADLSEAARAFPLGGLTASRAGPASAIGGRAGGLSGVLFGGGVEIVSGLTQGCAPLGPALTITGAEGNVISALDGRPAAEVLIEVVDRHFDGRLAEAWGRIHPAFPVPGRDRDDYLVRNFLGLDADKGLVAVGENVEPGQKMLICRRDQAGARQDLARMLADVTRRAGGRAKAGLYFSCVARGPNLFGPNGAELRQLRQALGEIPLVGFYAGGEISGDRLYGYTGVLALFL